MNTKQAPDPEEAGAAEAGQPKEESVTLGSYDAWSEVVGGVLAHFGVPGFLDNLPQFYERADREGEQHRGFISAWYETYGPRGVGVAELFKLVTDSDLDLNLGRGDERSQRTRLGIELKKLRDRRFGSLKVEFVGTRQRRAIYQLVRESEPCEPFATHLQADSASGEPCEPLATHDSGVQGEGSEGREPFHPRQYIKRESDDDDGVAVGGGGKRTRSSLGSPARPPPPVPQPPLASPPAFVTTDYGPSDSDGRQPGEDAPEDEKW